MLISPTQPDIGEAPAPVTRQHLVRTEITGAVRFSVPVRKAGQKPEFLIHPKRATPARVIPYIYRGRSEGEVAHVFVFAMSCRVTAE